MERLTRRNLTEMGSVVYIKCDFSTCNYECKECSVLEESEHKLKAYEDAEEQGFLAKVVHGEWIIEKSDTCYWYACSECGGYIPLNQYKKEWYSDFCPNCGAKMDGKEEGVKNG